ncbi:MAG: hypothetical protein ACMUIS_11095 [bacterium]
MKYNPYGHPVRTGRLGFYVAGHHWSRWRIVLTLLCILTILIIVDAKEYARCNHIYPDEILDLRFSIRSDAEISKNPELHNDSPSVFYAEDYRQSSLIHVPMRGYVPVKNSYILTAKGRLFSFHRYNS